MDVRGLLMDFAESPSFPAHPCFFLKHMSTNNIYIGTFNDHSQDHSKHVTINAPGADVSALVRNFFAEDVTPVQEEKPDNGNDHFPYLTKKCFEQKQVDAVEAEIQAAKTGTAEDMWRTLWDNENMGYLNVKHINATSLYHDIEKWYGKLPYKERNFRDARNKR